MTPHLWQLRADVRLLEEGARQWVRLSDELSTTADHIVVAARHALDQGWESEAAESYEEHRRRMVQQIDTFTTVAARIGSSLTALAQLVTTAQEELDRAWAPVAVVPHELVGSEQVLVLHPRSPADEELVRIATDAAKAIRGRLDLQLEAESARLRDAKMEIGSVRSELVHVVGGEWPVGVVGELGDVAGRVAASTGEMPWGPGVGVGGLPGATSAAGAPGGAAGAGTDASAAAGTGGVSATPALPALAPVSFTSPELTGLSAAALAAGTGLAAGAAARRGRKQEPQAPPGGPGMTPMGGMAAGAAVRGGSFGGSAGSAGARGAGGSGGPAGQGRSGAGAPRGGRPLRPELEPPEDRAARLEREREAAREAKRQLIAERQAERAARRAQRHGSAEPASPVEVRQVAPDEDRARRRE